MTTIFIPVSSNDGAVVMRNEVEPVTLTELVGMLNYKGVDMSSLTIVADCPFDRKALNDWSEITATELFGDEKAYQQAKRDLGKCLGMRGDKADKFIKSRWAYQTEKTPSEVFHMIHG